jgi:hypothetical protein
MHRFAIGLMAVLAACTETLSTWSFALSLIMTGVAAAQPAPPQPQPEPPPVTPTDSTAPPLAIAPQPPPQPPPPPPVPPPPPAHQESADSNRPTELAFGIGFGYALPTSLQTPNTTSVRLRLPNGLTFEPQLVFATTSTKLSGGIGGMDMTNKQNETTFSSLVRYPLQVHHKIDFELVGDASVSRETVDPEGDNNTRTITTAALGYGVALACWFTPHWNLSLTASNPLVSYIRTREEMAASGTVTTNKTTTVGLVFDPQVTLMIHLYN